MAIIPTSYSLYDNKTIELAAAEARDRAMAAAASADAASDSASQAAHYAEEAKISFSGVFEAYSGAVASESAAKSAQLGAEAARDAAENYSRNAFGYYSGAYLVGQHVDEVYSDFSGLYSTFADPFASLSEYGILQETGNESSSGSTAPEYIRDIAKAAFESRGVTMTSIGTYSDAAYSYSLHPSMTLVENQILRHQLLYSGGAYPSLSYSQLYVKTFATAELWIEIPSSGGVSDLTWPVGTWLEGSAPATLPSGYGYCVVLRNADLSSGLLMNLAYKYSI